MPHCLIINVEVINSSLTETWTALCYKQYGNVYGQTYSWRITASPMFSACSGYFQKSVQLFSIIRSNNTLFHWFASLAWQCFLICMLSSYFHMRESGARIEDRDENAQQARKQMVLALFGAFRRDDNGLGENILPTHTSTHKSYPSKHPDHPKNKKYNLYLMHGSY